MNIDGISEQILTKLINENLLNEFSDLYKLENHKEQILNFEGFKDKSYSNMINSINNSRKVKIANFIYALGIKDIGLSRAKLICEACNNEINKVINITFDELSNIDGLGEVIALNWINTFKDENFKKELNNLLKEITFINEEKKLEKLKGLTFVITGSINNFKNRDEMVEFIERFGGKTTSSVSSKVSFLINNDINSTSSKNKTAKELGIEIITEEELMEMTK
jgi:DNA ligase (NAD+)